MLWHFCEAQEDGCSWHSRPLLSSTEMGRHTLNCQQNRKAESCEICILTATVHKSVKNHCHTRWDTENLEQERERICEEVLMKTGVLKKYMTCVFTPSICNFTAAFLLLWTELNYYSTVNAHLKVTVGIKTYYILHILHIFITSFLQINSINLHPQVGICFNYVSK